MNFLSGGYLLEKECPATALLAHPEILKEPGIIKAGDFHQCQRCRQKFSPTLFCLPNQKSYCPFCLILGQVTEEDYFYHLPQRKNKEKMVPLNLTYPLTPSQEKISQALCQFIKEKKRFLLLWAVTGAGKTEMTFPVIQKILASGGQVAWATPRVDVVLELAPRLKQAFNQVSQGVLYGKSQEKYAGESFVVATTHQLLRFYEAFDLLIIDEVDAFPFTTEKMLQQAALKAVKKEGQIILLTATPTKKQLKLMKTGQLTTEILPARFHQNPLPVPTFVWHFHWEKRLLKKIPPWLKKDLDTGRWLIFCPKITWMKQFLPLLEKTFPKKRCTLIYAADSLRHEKVQQLRNEAYDLVLCTTILERGVTLKNIQVLVVGSNHPLFKKEVLLQIAGRVGRNQDFPTGRIIFLHEGTTQAMVQAKKEIQALNNLAKTKGMIV